MKREFEHFGIPTENIRAAEEAVKRQTAYELHSRVPTRREVATLGATEITEIMTNWMCRSPLEIVPSRAQIFEARAVLLARPDVFQLSRLVSMCDHYINNG